MKFPMKIQLRKKIDEMYMFVGDLKQEAITAHQLSNVIMLKTVVYDEVNVWKL